MTYRSSFKQQTISGFTLIELLVVIVVVSLLAMVAIPSYQNSIAKARRVDAQAALSSLSSAMERWFTEKGTYVGAAGSEGARTATGSPWIHPAATPINEDVKFYNLTIETATTSAYTLRATPINAQSSDGYMELLSTGVARWDINNDGDTNDTGEDHW